MKYNLKININTTKKNCSSRQYKKLNGFQHFNSFIVYKKEGLGKFLRDVETRI